MKLGKVMRVWEIIDTVMLHLIFREDKNDDDDDVKDNFNAVTNISDGLYDLIKFPEVNLRNYFPEGKMFKLFKIIAQLIVNHKLLFRIKNNHG
ncbi:CLUMA_CG000756, isoform A [Clunio marinus]|uniref:CLUMA_CG000756, isoform A n=1 Tax=Clunio marinus TaxID=568069 RepID=A0A1J1HGD4_9DIPT|nr:CLUMA_CG000756, isoform A [Clunio marinus]